MDRTHADRQGKENLPGGGEPGLGIGQAPQVRLPDEVQSGQGALHDARGVWGKREPADRQNNAEQNEQWHADLGGHFNALDQAARQNVDVHPERQNEPEDGFSRKVVDRLAFGADKLVEKRGRGDLTEGSDEGVENIGKRPRFDVHIIGCDAEGGKQTEDPDVLEPPEGSQLVKHAGGGMVPKLPAVAAYSPLHPKERYAHQ